ncbi:hypothetical protein BT96DRAFT_1018381 [Gymnopus androsaceus JB14]|uniref:Uncharacterized protein n=1 Tax=Gymnopus androsaceus JB14 TaxID=1447944 RepID=A0A6A4HVX3_9AGAR|nr:hypothetical protein BT96DRAFT_1018381 [Gymnopus androsaceus JB14]
MRLSTGYSRESRNSFSFCPIILGFGRQPYCSAEGGSNALLDELQPLQPIRFSDNVPSSSTDAPAHSSSRLTNTNTRATTRKKRPAVASPASSAPSESRSNTAHTQAPPSAPSSGAQVLEQNHTPGPVSESTLRSKRRKPSVSTKARTPSAGPFIALTADYTAAAAPSTSTRILNTQERPSDTQPPSGVPPAVTGTRVPAPHRCLPSSTVPAASPNPPQPGRSQPYSPSSSRQSTAVAGGGGSGPSQAIPSRSLPSSSVQPTTTGVEPSQAGALNRPLLAIEPRHPTPLARSYECLFVNPDGTFEARA